MYNTKLAILLVVPVIFIPISSVHAVSYYELAKHYAPVIVQSLEETKFGDYITRINYDGDYRGNNNWNNLGYKENDEWKKERSLPAYVYYSVIETETHYFICYALFHPADHYQRSSVYDPHENDLEGIIMCVHKDGNEYGSLRLVSLQAHYGFKEYKAPQADGIEDDEDEVHGDIRIADDVSPGVHPKVWVEAGGHGIKARYEELPHVKYYPTGTAQNPDNVGDIDEESRTVGYDLLSIHAEMWEHRKNPVNKLFDKPGLYVRHGFIIYSINKKFDGNDHGTDEAYAPWHWDDSYDGGDWIHGDWFMHPAGYHRAKFNWSESFSTNYVFHPFGYVHLTNILEELGNVLQECDHLGNDIYNGVGGTTTLYSGPYIVVQDVNILDGQTLNIKPGRRLFFDPGRKMKAVGKVIAIGSGETIYFVNKSVQNRGIKIKGELQIQKGGCICIR